MNHLNGRPCFHKGLNLRKKGNSHRNECGELPQGAADAVVRRDLVIICVVPEALIEGVYLNSNSGFF